MKIRIIPALLAVLAIAGCSSITVNQKYDHAMDFSPYRSFAWRFDQQPKSGNKTIDDKQVNKVIRDNILKQLTSKGFSCVSRESADCLIEYQVTFGETFERRPGTIYLGPAGSPDYWTLKQRSMRADAGIRGYEDRMLTINIVDQNKQKPLWLGSGSYQLYQGFTPKKSEERISKAIAKILKKFPPQQK